MHWHGGSTRVGKAPSYPDDTPGGTGELLVYPFYPPARNHADSGSPQGPPGDPPGTPRKTGISAPPKNGNFRPPGKFPPRAGGPRGGPPGTPPGPPKMGCFLRAILYSFVRYRGTLPPTPQNPQKWPKKGVQKRVLILSRLGELLNTQKNVHSRGVFPGFPSPGNPDPLGVSLGRPPNLARGARFSTTPALTTASVINTHLVGTRCSAFSDTSDCVLVSYIVCTVQARWRGGSSRVGQAPRPSRDGCALRAVASVTGVAWYGFDISGLRPPAIAPPVYLRSDAPLSDLGNQRP